MRTAGLRAEGKMQSGVSTAPIEELDQEEQFVLFSLEIWWAGMNIPQGKVIYSNSCGVGQGGGDQ